MRKEKLIKVLKEVGMVAMQFFFSRIFLFDHLSPVGLAFAFIRLFFNGNIFVVTGGYALSKLYTFFDFSEMIICAYEIVFLTLYYFTKEFVKIKRKLLLVYIFMILSNALRLYYEMFTLVDLIFFFINLISEIILLHYFYKLFTIYKNKFIFCRFSRLDYFMFSLTVLFLSIGIFSYKILLVLFGIFLINLALILICKIISIEKYLVFSIFFALGAVVASGDSLFLVYSTICAVLLAEMRDFNKIIFFFLSLVVFGACGFIFNMISILTIFAFILPPLIYLALPNKFTMILSNFFEHGEQNYIYKYSNENRINQVKNKLLLMSNTLSLMQNNFKLLLVGKIDRDRACKELAVDIIQNCCTNCEYYKSCYMGNINKRSLVEELIKKSIEYDGINFSDVTNGLQSYCAKSSMLMGEINRIAKLYLSYESAMKSEDESKLVIANELQNFANIFFDFTKIIDNFSILNERLSRNLKESLLNSMIDVKEAGIFETSTGIKSVGVISTNEQILKKEMLDSIYRVIKNRVKLKDVRHIEYSGLSYATFLPVSKLKISFSISSKAKEEKNGDNAVVQRLDENRYFIAIADGMGHGEKANRISAMVLSLIKSLFEVGFQEDLIIQSVNKLLLPAGLDNFTTLDSCVIDLENEVCTFVKLGSSVSILKHKTTSEVIACESLPIGIVQNIKPTIIKKQITAGDMIFIASDGIVDAFGSIDTYKSFINDSKIFNMKKYLDDVLSDAEYQNKKHPDDMTIIGINLLKN